ncbi:MAG: apolipoprotein N-acyltransferase [Candidatus Bruticola sp.]
MSRLADTEKYQNSEKSRNNSEDDPTSDVAADNAVSSVARSDKLAKYHLIRCFWSGLCSGEGYLGALSWGAASALLLCLCFPFLRCWPLLFMALVPFFLRTAQIKNFKHALCLGFSFGFVLHLVSMHWLSVFGWAAPPALAVEKGIIPSIVAVAIVWLRHKQQNFVLYSLGAASLYVIGEYLQSVGIFGMNWSFLAAALSRIPLLLQTNSLWGMWGLSFAVAFFNVGVAELLLYWKQQHGVLGNCELGATDKEFVNKRSLMVWGGSCVLLWAFIIVFGAVQLSSAPELEKAAEQPGAVKWGIIQLSIPQEKKFNPFLADENFDLLKKASFKAIEQGAEIVGWPETSVPYRRFLDNRRNRRAFKKMISERPAWYLVGSIEGAPDGGSYNTISLWSDQGIFQDRYEKWNIVPFGEYLPYRDYWPEWIPGVKLVMNYKPGKGSCALKTKNNQVGVLICFESMCTWVARQHVLKGAEILFAPTNDAWFKETSELPGHFDMAIMRAVELARPVIPVGNTGISGFIDRYGRVRQESKINEEAIMVDYVVPSNALTVYALMGDRIVWVYVLLLIMCSAFHPKMNKSQVKCKVS